MKELILDGLGCANCAAKIEKEVSSLSGVKTASIDLITKKLSIEIHNNYDFEDILNDTKKIIKRIEPNEGN